MGTNGTETTGAPPSPRSQKVVLWGPSSSGKTMYLAQLYHKRELYRNTWTVRARPGANSFIERMRDAIVTEIKFPTATTAGTVDIVEYDMIHHPPSQVRRELSLCMEDRPGKEWERLDEDRKNLLAGADALLLLFDPLRSLNLLKVEVGRTLEQIYQSRGAGPGTPKDPRPYAICMTKADEVIRSHHDFHLARTRPDEFVRRTLTARGYGELLAIVEDFCADFRLYPISSVGMRVQWGVVSPVVFYDERLQLRPGWPDSPLNLMEPIEGLMDRLGVQP